MGAMHRRRMNNDLGNARVAVVSGVVAGGGSGFSLTCPGDSPRFADGDRDGAPNEFVHAASIACFFTQP